MTSILKLQKEDNFQLRQPTQQSLLSKSRFNISITHLSRENHHLEEGPSQLSRDTADAMEEIGRIQ
jgi:hypothetical protein